jgi:hypothetical protein
MKILTILTLAAAAAATTMPAQAATNIGVSIGINAPGQYGRIDINNYPQPVLVMPQPVIYAATPQSSYQRPIYLYVSQAQRANWGRYCGGYRACGQPVYFVQEDWVRNEYRREHAQRGGHRADPGEHRRGRDDDGDRYQGNGHGNGHDNGHGRGKGHGR